MVKINYSSQPILADHRTQLNRSNVMVTLDTRHYDEQPRPTVQGRTVSDRQLAMLLAAYELLTDLEPMHPEIAWITERLSALSFDNQAPLLHWGIYDVTNGPLTCTQLTEKD